MINLRHLFSLNLVCCLFALWSAIGCRTSHTLSTAERENNFAELSKIIEDKQFTVVSDWANPMGGGQVNLYGATLNIGSLVNPTGAAGRVNLIGNPNEVSIDQDSARVYLPYFGEVQIQRNYGGRGGIHYEGTYSNYKIKHNADKQEIEVSFEIQDESENLKVVIQLYGNKKSRVILNSAYRHSITYDGEISRLKDALDPENEDPNDYFKH